jgi:hypothetical protein
MSMFWIVIACIFGGLLFLALAWGAIRPIFLLIDDEVDLLSWLVSLVCIILIAAYIAILNSAGAFKGGDDASHCGPGTHYVRLANSNGDSHSWLCVT